MHFPIFHIGFVHFLDGFMPSCSVACDKNFFHSNDIEYINRIAV